MPQTTTRYRLAFPVLIAAAATLNSFSTAIGQATTAQPTYQYAEQPGIDTLKKGDVDLKALTDGNDETAVWGAWDVKPFVVDWTFATPARVRSIRVAIMHPVDPSTDGTHPRQVELFVADQDGKFEDEANVTLPIPFQAGPRQEITLALPGDGLVARQLRTRFEGKNRQVVIGEVTFKTETATDGDLRAAWKAAVDNRAAPLKPVDALPVGRLSNVKAPPASSIFGAAGHMLHTDHFYPGKFTKYWRLEHTLPFVQQLGISSVREPIYQSYFFGDTDKAEPDSTGALDRAKNRKMIEDYIAEYDKAGVQVVVCAIFSNSGEGGTPGDTTMEPYLHWLANLAKKHKCIEAIEIGNEPNLTPFWNHTYQVYVDTARKAAKMIRDVKPDLPIVVGSFSGMGGVWMRPDMLAEAGSKEADQSIYWAKKCFEAGLLDFADGVSTHPYPEAYTQPEGGVFLQKRNDPNGYEKELLDFWNLIQQYNKTKRPLKLYFTELGYEVTNARTPEWQADYLSRMMLILFSTQVSGTIPLERVHWYDLKEDDTVVGASGWGLVSLNGSRVTPAFVAYQRVAHTFGETTDFQPLDVKAEFNNWPEIIKSYVWQRKSDKAIVVPFWRMEQLQKRPIDFDSELSLALPASMKPSRVEVVDLHADVPQPIGFEVNGGKLRTAVHVTDRAGWVIVYP